MAGIASLMKRAVVDADNTIWDLQAPLRKMLRSFYPDIPKVISPEWNWYKQFMTDEAFYAAVDAIHQLQINYLPLPGANELFITLNLYHYEIFIASHRRNGAAPALARWLEKHGLEPYSGIYTGPDKRFLIRAGDLVIDDAPDTIRYAHEVGADVVYLNWPWNSGCPGRGSMSLFGVIDDVNRMEKS